MSTQEQTNSRPSTRLVNLMHIYDFLPKAEWGEVRVVSPSVMQAAAPAFLAYVLEEVPGVKDDVWPWRNTPPGPRWKSMPNFGKKTLDELRALVGVQDVALKRVSVWVPANRIDELRQIAAQFCEPMQAGESQAQDALDARIKA